MKAWANHFACGTADGMEGDLIVPDFFPEGSTRLLTAGTMRCGRYCAAAGLPPARRPARVLFIATLLVVVPAAMAFELQAGVAFTSLHSFGVFTNGLAPRGPLVEGSEGLFYGTAGGAQTTPASSLVSAPVGR